MTSPFIPDMGDYTDYKPLKYRADGSLGVVAWPSCSFVSVAATLCECYAFLNTSHLRRSNPMRCMTLLFLMAFVVWLGGCAPAAEEAAEEVDRAEILYQVM